MSEETKAEGAVQEVRKKLSPKPSCGRIVHYKDREGNCWPAIVVCVDHDGSCVLHVFAIPGGFLAYKVREGFECLQWSWPPKV